MDRITFTVPAVPVAQPRQRHRIATSGGNQFVKNYTPAKHKVNDFKASVRMSAHAAYQGPPLTGALRVVLSFIFPTKRKSRVPKATKPDGDNLAKSVLDALNGLTFKDDGQVYDLRVEKWHAAGDEQPHVVVTIEPI
jgi:Holliday junction resolvase RusA-like endonuclease